MTTFPRPEFARWRRAAGLIVISVFFGFSTLTLAAEAPTAAAEQLYREGHAQQARTALEKALTTDGDRLPILRGLLDLCLRTQDQACVTRHAPAFTAAAEASPTFDPAAQAAPGNDLRRAGLASEVFYYQAAAAFAEGGPPVEILKQPHWGQEIAYARELYLHRQLLAARLHLAAGDPAGAEESLNRLLSLVASIQNPQAQPELIAETLAETIALMLDVGQPQRAWGIYRSVGQAIGETLPPLTVPAIRFRLVEAELLQGRRDDAGARRILDEASKTLARIEATADERRRLAGRAARLKWAGCMEMEDVPCSDGTFAEAVQSLSDEPALWGGPDFIERQIATERPGALRRLMLQTALASPDRPLTLAEQDRLFGFMQLAARSETAFDTEAAAALAQAKTELQRRTIHQGLRLAARRDQQIRAELQKVATAMRQPAEPGRLTHDTGSRMVLSDFDHRILAVDLTLAADGLSRRGAVATPLANLQPVLAPDEALLATAKAEQGVWTYVCVRKDRVLTASARVDPLRLKLDSRLLQAALTAGHAPSEALDTQFPAEAAVRLYDVLIRPFEPCLRPGDRIVWLGAVADAPVPLATLLPAVPPKLEGGGYDLAKAEWLVRRHAVSYAGSASLIVAARTRPRAATGLDFLGVGDPVLTGRLPSGEDASKALLRGTRVSALAPLPDTAPELEDSARGFRAPRLLLRDAATERGLRAEMVGDYRFMSFATHGLLREDLQGLSEPALVLTPAASDAPLDDGLFTTNEIADLNLRAEFVALSACNTANFDLQQMAQDLPALASAFAVAGVPSTLGTLWPVDSLTGRQVVARVFAGLKDSAAGPAEALARAQRAFLDAPPGRAYLHPRFWAPFVVLGDGGPAVAIAQAGGPQLASTEVFSRQGGEVFGMHRDAGAIAVSFVSEPDASGRRSAGLRLLDAKGAELWRRTEPGATSRFMARLGGGLLTGGYDLGAKGRFIPTLTLRGPDGAPRFPVWRGDDVAEVDAFIAGGAQLASDMAVIAVAEQNLRDAPQAGEGRLHVLSVGPDMKPRPLFQATAPGGAEIVNAAVAPLGADLLVAYSYAIAPAAPAFGFDDYGQPTCRPGRVTVLELRRRSGELIRSQPLKDLDVVVAESRGGKVLLGGAHRPGCGEFKALVLETGPDLKPSPLYEDRSLGLSEVRAIAPLPGGRTFVAASKQNVVDYRPPDGAAAAKADIFAVLPFTDTFSGMVLTLDREGRPSEPRLLDSGSNIYVSAAQPGGPGEVILGGAVAGQAALFRLREAKP